VRSLLHACLYDNGGWHVTVTDCYQRTILKLLVPSLPQYWSSRMMDFFFPSTFVPGSKKSTKRTFVPVELLFRGTFVLRQRKFQELSLPGTLAPWERLFIELLIYGTFAPNELLLQYSKILGLSLCVFCYTFAAAFL